MENYILFTQLNDFVFCPISIYFHNTYQDMNTKLYQAKPQVIGTQIHETIDDPHLKTRSDFLTGLEVISEKYHLLGKIDIYDPKKCELIERKSKIKTIYDGYIFQLYAQYFAMTEMGYPIKHLKFYSYQDNKSYPVPLPNDDLAMLKKFEDIILEIQNFNIENFCQTNPLKCQNCIYEPACDRSI